MDAAGLAGVISALAAVLAAAFAGMHRITATAGDRVDTVTSSRIDDLEVRIDQAEHRAELAERKHARCEQQLARLEGEVHAIRAQQAK